MIILKHLDQLDNANKRAMKLRPALRVLDFGIYEVQSSKGFWYTVTCKVNEHGQRLVFCTCEDIFPRRAGVPCYHMAPAVGAHILLAQARRSVLAPDNVITFPQRQAK